MMAGDERRKALDDAATRIREANLLVHSGEFPEWMAATPLEAVDAFARYTVAELGRMKEVKDG